MSLWKRWLLAWALMLIVPCGAAMAEDLFALYDVESAYEAVYTAMLMREPKCDLTDYDLSVEAFEEYWDLPEMLDDNPLINYVTDWQWRSINGVLTEINFNYSAVPKDHQRRLNGEVAVAMEAIGANLQRDHSPAELVCAISDYIAVHCEYAFERDGKTPDHSASNVYSALIEGRAICEGYADAFTLLAKRWGLEVEKVTGESGPGGDSHAWNLVRIEGAWYHVDVTWNDPTPDVPGGARHTNLLLSDAAAASRRGGSEQYHAAWDADAPQASDTRYEDAFWVHVDEPISFREMPMDEWERSLAEVSLEEVLTEALEANAPAELARFQLSEAQLHEVMEQIDPYVGYHYVTRGDGTVVRIDKWTF